jgi:hypothetical protein
VNSEEITRTDGDNRGPGSYVAAMKKIVLVFGLISGFISSALMFATLPLMGRGIVNFDNGEVLGYTSILLSFLLVFFGIRAYRDNVGGGTITFGRGFTVGILITLISCVFYVISWEIIYFKIAPDFGDKYAAHAIEKMRASGATPAAIEATKAQMASYKKIWDNPFLNAAMTLIEPFPVGLLVTLVSAAILRRKKALVPALA